MCVYVQYPVLGMRVCVCARIQIIIAALAAKAAPVGLALPEARAAPLAVAVQVAAITGPAAGRPHAWCTRVST